jgi:hypothetical protein
MITDNKIVLVKEIELARIDHRCTQGGGGEGEKGGTSCTPLKDFEKL